MIESGSVVITPKSWQLIRKSGTAYWTLTIQVVGHRFFLVQRHGKMGAVWPKSPFFDGISIGDISGYDSETKAFEAGVLEVAKKLKQKYDKAYRLLSSSECLITTSKNGRQAMEKIQSSQTSSAVLA